MRTMKIGIYLTLAFLTACSTGHCRRDGVMVPQKEDVELPTSYKPEDKGPVMVSKSDGSIQCQGGGLSLEDMARQLEGIKVLSSKKVHDGFMRIQSCGTGTGMMNVYEIPFEFVAKAKELGFGIYEKR